MALPAIEMRIARDGDISAHGAEFVSPREIVRQKILDRNFALSGRVPLNRGILSTKSVALHERNHVELALSQNKPFSIVSVIPEGNSLGRTIFPFSLEGEEGALIAVGGIVHGQGFGSDQMHAFFNLLPRKDSGLYSNEDIDRAWDAVEKMTSKAAMILGREDELAHIEAEILAYLGEADMSTYFEIKERARFEREVISFGLENLLSEVTAGIIREENHFVRPENFISTTTIGPGVKVIETYVNGKLSEWVCSCCHSHDGSHSANCLVNNDRWKERFQKFFTTPFEFKNPFESELTVDDNDGSQERIVFKREKSGDGGKS